MNNQNTINAISPEALQVLGGGKLAYVKTIRSRYPPLLSSVPSK